MACARRQREGICNHHQCEYPDDSNCECVDIIDGKCEVGLGCIEDCPFSYKEKPIPEEILGPLRARFRKLDFEVIESAIRAAIRLRDLNSEAKP